MALRKEFKKEVFGQTLTFNDAYFKIERVYGNKHSVQIEVTGYDNSERHNEIFQRNYSFIPEVEDGAENFIKQGYEYLKTLDEYADAIDC